ncbi:MAG TPA: TlpA disulfide reductase family protein, partial [Solirubrobacteraceae bacterium]|nr:TlpA disulfide reductase family protein [Solirubrobacteraceae bacterium]
MRPRVYWPVSLAAAALVALLTYGVASTGEDRSIDSKLAAGDRVEAPVRDLPVLGSDATGSLADHAGKVVVLNVWASWCEPCKTEMPLLQKTHERIQDRGGLVL